MDNIFKEYLNAGTQTNFEKNKKNLFFTPLNAEYSSFSQTYRKKIKKLQKKTSKFNTKAKKNTSKFTFFKKENALVSNSNLNINKSLKYDTSYKKNEQNDMNCNYTSVSKIKKKYINKLKEKINSKSIPKKNNICNFLI